MAELKTITKAEAADFFKRLVASHDPKSDEAVAGMTLEDEVEVDENHSYEVLKLIFPASPEVLYLYFEGDRFAFGFACEDDVGRKRSAWAAEQQLGPLTMNQWAEQVLELGTEAAFGDFDMNTSIPRALIMHGAFCFVLRDPNLPLISRHTLESMTANLEVIFEDKGLTPPPSGWRSAFPEVPVADWAAVDGSREKEAVPVCNSCETGDRVEPVGLSRGDSDNHLYVWVCRRCEFAIVVRKSA